MRLRAHLVTEHGNRPQADDASGNEEVLDDTSARRLMLSIENVHCPIELDGASQRSGSAALALEMGHHYGGKVTSLPASLANPKAQVEILSVHPERFVEEAGNLEGLSTDHHERSGNRIHGCRLVGVQVGEVVGAKFSDLRKASGQAEEMVQSDARRWK